ncbi:unnamed protein product [Angiostrongylus costaricensis]|uniref:MFS domain-containing protein n=1 Tax=Angiostrongylus costaricensis TaxID=334426 RepID=A0A0R3PPW0_ANGCS|nr:unnamed protein product [Angiostrongylus costaricensis]
MTYTFQEYSAIHKTGCDAFQQMDENLVHHQAILSVGGGFMFGYQVLITNPAQGAFIQFLNISYTKTHGVQQNQETLELIWGLVMSTFFWGATLGSLLIQVIADSLGRKNGIVAAFVVQIAGLAIAIASYFVSIFYFCLYIETL